MQGPATAGGHCRLANDGVQPWLVIAPSPAMVMVPVTFTHLPALRVVLIARTGPTRPLIRRTVPAPRHPLIAPSLWAPVAADPGIARTGKRPTALVPDSRGRLSDIHRDLCRGRNGESGYEQ